VFSQKVVLQIYERQELVSYRKTSIDSVLTNPDLPHPTETVDVRYILNLDDKTSSYYVDGEMTSVLPIETVFNETGGLVVRILEEGFDYGLVLHTEENNPSAIWYWYTDGMTTIKKMISFEFIKNG
jgi:hypothetical protein